MAEIHKDLQTLGAKEMGQRYLPQQISIASEMSGLHSREGFTHAGFAMTALPHRPLPPDQDWTRDSENTTLIIQPLKIPTPQGHVRLGVPYGAYARLIMIFLQSQAILTGSREIEVGSSMRGWMKRMGVSTGGKQYRLIRDQLQRLASCTMMIHTKMDRAAPNSAIAFDHDTLIKSGVLLWNDTDDERQQTLWQDRVILSETFYSQLQQNPVVIAEDAVRLLKGNSLALDFYVWLAYTLPSLEHDITLPVSALHSQFGESFARPRDIKRHFAAAFGAAMAAYPQANVILDEEAGLIHLKPSAPPAMTRLVHVSRSLPKASTKA